MHRHYVQQVLFLKQNQPSHNCLQVHHGDTSLLLSAWIAAQAWCLACASADAGCPVSQLQRLKERRTSTGNWVQDRVTWQEEKRYKQAMGYLR